MIFNPCSDFFLAILTLLITNLLFFRHGTKNKKVTANVLFKISDFVSYLTIPEFYLAKKKKQLWDINLELQNTFATHFLSHGNDYKEDKY